MTGLIILAAGSSSRLGTPKQNLVYKGHSLLHRAVETAVSTVGGENVMVILGANQDLIRPTISGSITHIIDNADWREGIASSIRAGIRELVKFNSGYDSVILMLCDQPFVSPLLLRQLIKKRAESNSGIIASAYKNILGVPVLFDSAYFPELLSLQGKDGAKRIINTFPEDVSAVDFPLGETDIDTIEDYKRLSGSSGT